MLQLVTREWLGADGRVVGNVNADNNDGCEDMQVRVYCAGLSDSVLIYCSDRRPSLKKQTQNTLHIQNYDSEYRKTRGTATWSAAIAVRRIHRGCFGAAEPNPDACMPFPQQKEPRRCRYAAQPTSVDPACHV